MKNLIVDRVLSLVGQLLDTMSVRFVYIRLMEVMLKE